MPTQPPYHRETQRVAQGTGKVPTEVVRITVHPGRSPLQHSEGQQEIDRYYHNQARTIGRVAPRVRPNDHQPNVALVPKA